MQVKARTRRKQSVTNETKEKNVARIEVINVNTTTLKKKNIYSVQANLASKPLPLLLVRVSHWSVNS